MSKYATIDDVIREKIRNRARSSDRPSRWSECRDGVMHLAVQCVKERGGHEFTFVQFDHYGCCSHCGCEVLT